MEDNDDSGNDLDEMAEQLEQEMINASPTLRRSPRKHVPQSPLTKDLSTQNESSTSTQNTSTLKQKTLHGQQGGILRGSQEGTLGGNDGGMQELRGIKRITFTRGESPHPEDTKEREVNLKVVKDVKGRMISEVAMDIEGSMNSEVAVVNPKPILSGHQNSAFQKFSKSTDKQEKCRGETIERLHPQLPRETVNTANSRFTCDKNKNVDENNTNIQHKRTECLEKHAFRPVAENLEDSDSMSATETKHRIKEYETPCNSNCVKDDLKIQCEKETIADQQAGKSNLDSDKEVMLSVRTLRKSFSLPEGKLSPELGKVRRKRNMSLSQKSPGKDFDSSDSKVKAGHESPRRSLRNRINYESKQKCAENSDACLMLRKSSVVNSLSKFAPPKPPSRLTRSQTLQVPTDELDSLCQRSRSRMRIPSGKKRKEEESGNVGRQDIKEEDVESDEVEEGVKEDRRRTTRAMSRQDSLGFVLRSPPVLKSPPIVLPCQKAMGKAVMSKISPPTSTYPETKKKEDVSAKIGYGGCFVPSVEGLGRLKYDKDNDSTKKINHENLEDTVSLIHESLYETSVSKASDKISENVTVREGHDEKDKSVSNQTLSMRDGELKHCKKGSSVEEEELEGSLPRQGSMGFIVSGEAVAGESEKSSPKQTGKDSYQNQEKRETDFTQVSSAVLNNLEEGSTISNQEHNVQKNGKVLEKVMLNGVEIEDNSKLPLTKDSDKEQPKLLFQDTNHSGREFIPSDKTAAQGTVSLNTETAVTKERESHSIQESSNIDNPQNVSDMSWARGQVHEHEVLMTDGGENPVNNVKDPIKSISKSSADLSCSTMNSADISNACEFPTGTFDKPDDPGNFNSEVHFPSTSSVSGDASRGPSSSSVEGSCISSVMYIPSLSKLVQKSSFPAVVASSTVLSPEMEDLPSQPHTDNSTIPGSPSTLSTGGPVSPLPPSPFHFFLSNPISPLPPSPIREVAPLSPLCSSPFDLEAPCLSESSSSSVIQTETAHSLQENHRILDSKSSISSSARKLKSRQHTAVSHVTKETKSSQSFQSGKKSIQSENTPRTFHAVAPPDAIAVKPQKNKDIAQTASAQNSQKTRYVKTLLVVDVKVYCEEVFFFFYHYHLRENFGVF